MLLAARPAPAATDITLWHAMPGELGYQIEKLAEGFNASQADYRVVPVFKGLYTETMMAALFAMRLRQHPAIVQVAEVATATMMAARGAIVPVHELMREQHAAFDPKDYLPVIAGYYSDAGGNMMSFPLNASTPILFYNKDQFRFAGLNADEPPKTWPEVGADSPTSTRKRVDLPAPEGPSTPSTWPGCASTSTPRRISLPPRR